MAASHNSIRIAIDIDAIVEATASINPEELFDSIRAEYGISIDDTLELDADNLNDNDAGSLIEDHPSSATQEQTTLTATWATEIIAIAMRLLEYYAAQGNVEFEDDLTEGELIYELDADDRTYLLIRSESTGECNVRGTGREFDARRNRGITQQDIEIWRGWSDCLDQQSKPVKGVSTASIAQSVPTQALPEVPLTLETANQLTEQQWLDLTPRQQLNLAIAARQHQRTEPGGYAQAEQWVGQRSGLVRQLNTVKAQERSARETLQDIKEQGERSFFNPFGATKTERYDASIDLSAAKEARKRLEAEIKRIDDRQAQRQQQDAARQTWRTTPASQSTQRILALIEQPELKAQFEAVEYLSRQLQQWREWAQSDPTALRAEAIQTVAAAYLDGYGLSERAQQQMQHDLKQAQQQSQKRDQGLSL